MLAAAAAAPPGPAGTAGRAAPAVEVASERAPCDGAGAGPGGGAARLPGPHLDALTFDLDEAVLARHAWRMQGHALLRCGVVQRPEVRLVFCLSCGAVMTGKRPGKLLNAPCNGRRGRRGAGEEQLRLIRQLKWPHYRAGHQGERLVGPFAIDFDERLELSVSLLGSQGAAAGGAQGAACEAVEAPPEGRAARLHLLRCHGLRESDIEEVRELGRAATRAATSLGSDSEDCDEGHTTG